MLVHLWVLQIRCVLCVVCGTSNGSSALLSVPDTLDVHSAQHKNTALHLAAKRGREDVAESLLYGGIDFTALNSVRAVCNRAPYY